MPRANLFDEIDFMPGFRPMLRPVVQIIDELLLVDRKVTGK
jgi:hypothetical protein